jgi:uncharacterized protein (UPF0548 family)
VEVGGLKETAMEWWETLLTIFVFLGTVWALLETGRRIGCEQERRRWEYACGLVADHFERGEEYIAIPPELAVQARHALYVAQSVQGCPPVETGADRGVMG